EFRLPRRQCKGQQRQECGRSDRHDPEQVPFGCRPAPQEKHHTISEGEKDGCLDHLRFPSFFAFSISSDIRSNCSSERSEPPLPRRAATAFSGEPSKKVSIMYRNTDC